ncbi:hypothetical protein AB4Y64_04125 [Lysobacter sp. TAF61]|uniref:hypothetical protein n=1 Tax=Lysobacter sp. TAF61 TaxID=3233072 RepID=UPI003F9B24F3
MYVLFAMAVALMPRIVGSGWTDAFVYVMALAALVAVCAGRKPGWKSWVSHGFALCSIAYWASRWLLDASRLHVTTHLHDIKNGVFAAMVLLEVAAGACLVREFLRQKGVHGLSAIEAFANTLRRFPLAPPLMTVMEVEFNIWCALWHRLRRTPVINASAYTGLGYVQTGYTPEVTCRLTLSLLLIVAGATGLTLVAFEGYWWCMPLVAGAYVALLLNAELVVFRRTQVLLGHDHIIIPNGAYGLTRLETGNIAEVTLDEDARACGGRAAMALRVARLRMPNVTVRLHQPVAVAQRPMWELHLCLLDPLQLVSAVKARVAL